MDTEKYFDYILSETQKILAIDSPSGFTRNVADYVLSAYRALGYEPVQTVKGGVFCEIGGADTKDALLMEAHIDTLGAMVSEIRPNGYLALSPIGGMNANNAEAENCTVYTRDGRTYTGTFQLQNASIQCHRSSFRRYGLCRRRSYLP